MENFKALFDLTKLPTKFFFLFSVVSGFILFAKENILSKIHLTEVNEKYGWIIGLVFIISSVLVIVNFIIWLFDISVLKFREKKLIKIFKVSLRNLDTQEKSVLREFVINDQSSIKVPIDDPVVSGLLKKRIININKQFGNSFIMTGNTASVSLHPIADKVLTLADLDLNEKPSEDDKHFFLQNRPEWTNRWRY